MRITVAEHINIMIVLYVHISELLIGDYLFFHQNSNQLVRQLCQLIELIILF